MNIGKEDYLKCIHSITLQNEKVTNVLISKTLQVSKPAVTEMLRKLEYNNLIFKVPTHGYRLTESGLKLVSKIIRKHRILEVFLLNSLNYSIEEIHEEAEILEHCVSDLFIDRIEKLMNFPSICPHGKAIPKKDEIYTNTSSISLNQALVGKEYEIFEISKIKEINDYLQNIHLSSGSIIKVLELDTISEIVKIEYNNQIFELDFIFSEQILLKI